MIAIQTSETKLRSARPNRFGMHPFVTERLQSFGLDPYDHAEAIRAKHRTQKFRASRSVLQQNKLKKVAHELSLDPGDLYLKQILDQAAIMYWDGEFIADVLSPVERVKLPASAYKVWDFDTEIQEIDTLISNRDPTNEIIQKLSDLPYQCKDRGLQGETLRAAAMINPSIFDRVLTTEKVMKRLLRMREVRVARLFHTAANYPSTNKVTLGAGRQWNGGASATAVADILLALEKIAAPVTDCAMSDLVWHGTQINAELKTILASQLDNKGLLRPMDFGLYFGIPDVHISRLEFIDSSGVRQRVWNEANVWIGTVSDMPDEASFSRTFRQLQPGGDYDTQTWYDPKVGKNGVDWTKVTHSDDEVIPASTYGYLIINAKQ